MFIPFDIFFYIKLTYNNCSDNKNEILIMNKMILSLLSVDTFIFGVAEVMSPLTSNDVEKSGH